MTVVVRIRRMTIPTFRPISSPDTREKLLLLSPILFVGEDDISWVAVALLGLCAKLLTC